MFVKLLDKRGFQMNIELLTDIKSLRNDYIKNFLMTWEQFQIEHKEFIANLKEKYNIIADEKFYEDSLMWDKMPTKYPYISFDKALKLLKSVNGDVLFMAEDESNPNCQSLFYDNKSITNFIAKADANELAELIEYEWYENYRLAEQYMYRDDFILPIDLYVFDYSMNWTIVFTHETRDWELESDNPMEAAKGRICIVQEFFKK